MKTIRDEHFGPEHGGRWRTGAAALCLAGLIGCGGGTSTTTDGGGTDTPSGTDTGPSMTDGGVDSGQAMDVPVGTDVPVTTDVPVGTDVPVATDAPPLTMPGAATQLVGGPAFTRPLDVVLTASGTTAYFIAYDGTTGTPEVFRSPSSTGSSTTSITATGAPLDSPLALAISADDSTIYIADATATAGTTTATIAATAGLGAILSVNGEGSTAPTVVNIGTAVRSPRAIAISGATGSENLTFIATDSMGPGVFRVSTAGGTALRLDTAGTLVDPAALTVASDNSVYILDARGGNQGALFHLLSTGGAPVALPAAGAEIGLRMRFPAGIALSLDGNSIFVSAWDPGNGSGLLTWMAIDGTGMTSPAVYAPTALTGIVSPCGLHRARTTEIFAVADELSTGTGAILTLH